MLDIDGDELMIRPGCRKDHDTAKANLIKNKYQQRYWEWPCGCTQVYSGMLRPDKSKPRSGVAKYVDNSSFVKGLFKSDFDL